MMCVWEKKEKREKEKGKEKGKEKPSVVTPSDKQQNKTIIPVRTSR